MHRRGVATAIGALLFLLIAFSMLGLFIMTFRLQSELSTMYMQKMENTAKMAKISASVSYVKLQDIQPLIGSTVKYATLMGKAEDDGPDSLTGIDTKYIVLTSVSITESLGGEKSLELIKNGDFRYRSQYWDTYGRQWIGGWSFDGRYAIYWGLNPREISAYIRQNFTYSMDYRDPVLSFTYKYSVFPTNVIRNVEVRIIDSRGILVFRNPLSPKSVWTKISLNLSEVPFSKGIYTLTFNINLRDGNRLVYISFYLDNVSLLVNIPGANYTGFMNNVADIYFDTIDDSVSSFYLASNETTFLEVYAFNYTSNLWSFTSKYIFEPNTYVNITSLSNKTRFFFYSMNPFQVKFDYMRISRKRLADMINITLKNIGDGEERILSIWINNTRYPSSGILDFYILPGESRTLTIDLSSIGITLEPNNVYVIEIVGERSKYSTIIKT